MSLDLITDRTQADVDYLKTLMATPVEEWLPAAVADEARVGQERVGMSDLEWFSAGDLRGAYTWVDLNRVGEAMAYIADLLTEAGYLVRVSPRTDWQNGDVMRPADAAAYLSDLAEIKRQLTLFASTPNAPANLEKLLYTAANNIERILLDVFARYNTMLTTRVPSGAATSGGDYL